jgi:hypothetical protein
MASPFNKEPESTNPAYRKAAIFGRIFGAKRQKPGFPLQVLGSAHALPVGFPLQSLAQRQRKIASRFCRQPGRMGDQPLAYPVVFKTLNRLLDFFGFAVKEFCGAMMKSRFHIRNVMRYSG